MKTIAIVLAICIAGAFAGVVSDEQKLKLREFRVECVAETGASDEAIESAKMGVFAEGDEKLACFASCLLKKTGFINAEGVFDEAVFRSRIPPSYPKEEVDKLITKCKPVGGAGNACAYGGNLLKCYLENKTISILQ